MGKNFNGAHINGSPTITEAAGAKIDDCRNKIMKYDRYSAGNRHHRGRIQ